MLHEKLRITLGLLVLFFLFIILATTDNFYGENIEKPPLVAATLDSQQDQIISDELEELLINDNERTILEPLDKNEEGAYLLLRWSTKIDSMKLYMRQIGQGDGDSYFELWSQDDTKIASGKLTQGYEEYSFDLSKPGLSHEDYALFNYGPSNIEINYVLGSELPETKTNKLLDIFAEGFI
jgi:hypothetical protein